MVCLSLSIFFAHSRIFFSSKHQAMLFQRQTNHLTKELHALFLVYYVYHELHMLFLYLEARPEVTRQTKITAILWDSCSGPAVVYFGAQAWNHPMQNGDR
jgi:hypothetical protein